MNSNTGKMAPGTPAVAREHPQKCMHHPHKPQSHERDFLVLVKKKKELWGKTGFSWKVLALGKIPE